MNLEELLQQFSEKPQQMREALEEFLLKAQSVDRTELPPEQRARLTKEINVAVRLKLAYSEEFREVLRKELVSQIDPKAMSAEEQKTASAAIGSDLLDEYSWK